MWLSCEWKVFYISSPFHPIQSMIKNCSHSSSSNSGRGNNNICCHIWCLTKAIYHFYHDTPTHIQRVASKETKKNCKRNQKSIREKWQHIKWQKCRWAGVIQRINNIMKETSQNYLPIFTKIISKWQSWQQKNLCIANTCIQTGVKPLC